MASTHIHRNNYTNKHSNNSMLSISMNRALMYGSTNSAKFLHIQTHLTFLIAYTDTKIIRKDVAVHTHTPPNQRNKIKTLTCMLVILFSFLVDSFVARCVSKVSLLFNRFNTVHGTLCVLPLMLLFNSQIYWCFVSFLCIAFSSINFKKK